MLTYHKNTITKAGTILVVDDDEEDRLLLQNALEDLMPMLNVHLASNAEEALAFVCSSIQLPLLVITDMHMPLWDGAELTRWLRQRFQPEDLPIIVVSSLTNGADELKCTQAGADAYLNKPRSYRDLHDTVEGILDTWASLGVMQKAVAVN